MPVLICTVGLPGSGKTTRANELMAKHPQLYCNLNLDTIRLCFCGNIHNYNYNKKTEDVVGKLQMQMAVVAVEEGKNIIISDTNLSDVRINKWKTFAKNNNYTFQVLDMFAEFKKEHQDNGKVPEFFIYNDYVERCRKYNFRRHESVPDKVISDMAERSYYSKMNPFVQDTTLEHAIIVDVDGTIAHIVERNPYDVSKVLTDSVDPDVLKSIIAEKEKNGYKIIIMSGRPDTCKADTEMWLKQAGVPYDAIFMRKDGDLRSDDIVKHELFMNNVRNKYYITKCYDDRDRVCFMWRKLLGLKVYQVEYGDF